MNAGSNKAFSITPSAYYEIAGVTVDGTSVGVVNSYTFSNIAANHTIAASFNPLVTYTITASAGQGGQYYAFRDGDRDFRVEQSLQHCAQQRL